MNTVLNDKKIKSAKLLITILSIVIPLVVAVLFKVKIDGLNLKFLPKIYASINGLTAILLLLALYFIKTGKMKRHQLMIQISMGLSIIFLLLYVLYHMTSDSTKYLGNFPVVYFTLLISHIFLSVIVIPLVLYTYLFAWMGNYQKHKKMARFAWPIWFYVAVSGVLVYLMISPYYQ